MNRTTILTGALAALAAAVLISAADGADDERAPRPIGVNAPLDPALNTRTKAKIALGKELFTDRRLSIDGDLSCASCHISALGFTDGRPRPIGRNGKRLARNAPTLLNVGLVRDLFHDGRAPSLEEQARAVILNPDELGWPDAGEFAEHVGSIAELRPRFKEAFGDDRVTLQRVVRALGAFQRTLVAGDAPFDRWWNGDEDAMSASAARGYRLFIDEGGCAACHSIRQSHATFSDGRFHNTGAGKDDGLVDRGRAEITGRDEDVGAFRTPTLRNVALTAPYMHDGSLATLAEVVDFYADGGRDNPHLSALMRPLRLDDDDRADLVAFLEALTSPEMPTLDACEELLKQGRHDEALEAFAAEIERLPDSLPAVHGLARAALAVNTVSALARAENALVDRVATLSPGGERDGDDPVLDLLTRLAGVRQALAFVDAQDGAARAEDALFAFRRARRAGNDARRVRTAIDEARWLETLGRDSEAVALVRDELALAADAPRALRLALAETRYRTSFRRFKAGTADDGQRAEMRAVMDALDALHAEERLRGDPLLYRAYAPHYAASGEGADSARAAARERYVEAARLDESVAERALTGLGNLMATERSELRELLERLLAERPDSAAALYHAGFVRLEGGEHAAAAEAFSRRIEVEETPSAWPRVFLARCRAAEGDRDGATDAYLDALVVDRSLPQVVGEAEQFIRARPLDGFAAVDALLADYDRFLATRPDDVRFQVLARNNVAFQVRDVVAGWMSRGPARVQTFPAGVPDDAPRLLQRCLALYEEAVRRIPENLESLPFKERWAYASVLNDTGLMYHYFEPLRDLERAESLYLQAFDLTRGAYQDAYFYNLQFLYGFELDGRDEKWFELAEIAKDAILREDPSSPEGFAPDEFKRRAARRDFERLAAALGR